MCVYYMGLGSNGYFMASVALIDGHYKMDIISGVSQVELSRVANVMYCMIQYLGH